MGSNPIRSANLITMIDNSKEYILCAALKRRIPREQLSDGSPYWKGTNDIMNIELGYRHHDIYQRFPNEVSSKMFDQGFYTSRGRFVGRHEAMKIAYESGQVTKDKAIKSNNYGKDLDHMFINIIEDTETKSDIEDKLSATYKELFSEDLY